MPLQPMAAPRPLAQRVERVQNAGDGRIEFGSTSWMTLTPPGLDAFEHHAGLKIRQT